MSQGVAIRNLSSKSDGNKVSYTRGGGRYAVRGVGQLPDIIGFMGFCLGLQGVCPHVSLGYVRN